MNGKVTLNLDRSGRAGYQISINLAGQHGYRLLGPKYLGDSEELRVVTLDERDAREIREYLDHIDGGDKAAEQRGFDRAVALLRDAAAVGAWADAAMPTHASHGVVSDILALYLEANRAAPAVLGIGEQA